jgi:hypothetical protein
VHGSSRARLFVWVEREPKFKDRVRGEFLSPWGAEAVSLAYTDCYGGRVYVGALGGFLLRNGPHSASGRSRWRIRISLRAGQERCL